MSDITLYHNPKCSKSRKTLAILQENNIEPTIIDYIKNPPSANTWHTIITQLTTEPATLVRTNDALFQEIQNDYLPLTTQSITALLTAHPSLVQRPIVVGKDQAIISRPPELVLGLLS